MATAYGRTEKWGPNSWEYTSAKTSWAGGILVQKQGVMAFQDSIDTRRNELRWIRSQGIPSSLRLACIVYSISYGIFRQG